VVIRDFNGVSMTFPPLEANAVLIVDANAVLTFPIASQLLQAIARRHPQVFEDGSRI
jgi:hypothetical protein